ncbi:MAG: hypothetical protein O3A47_13585 [Chloroflexi bacterium]|nr:hypothetical protein [Chloroflexota bacterium]
MPEPTQRIVLVLSVPEYAAVAAVAKAKFIPVAQVVRLALVQYGITAVRCAS